MRKAPIGEVDGVKPPPPPAPTKGGPTLEEMLEALDQAANVQLALSRDRVATECARRLRAAASRLESGGAAAPRACTRAHVDEQPKRAAPAPKPDERPAAASASRIGALWRAADVVVALRRPGPAGAFLVDADEMRALENAVRPFQVVMRGADPEHPGKTRRCPQPTNEPDEEESDVSQDEG